MARASPPTEEAYQVQETQVRIDSMLGRAAAYLALVGTAGLSVPLHAAIVTTPQVASDTAEASAERHRLASFLERQDVQKVLVEHGVDPRAALDRVNNLTGDEARRLAARLDQMPAGGDAGVIGILFAVFIILLVTDILGLTKVFPFTRSVRR
jgi:Family of unknown function (DUF6627)